MAEEAKVLRIVVASPGDLEAERKLVPLVVDEVNRGVAGERGLVLKVTRWEKDAFPGFHSGGPQALIDAILRIPECDIFIGIFWKRFGTPVADAKSGTEHEYKLAYETWKKKGRPQIFFYFNEKASSPKSKEETDQWGLVLEFKKNFPKEGLWWPYKGKAEFRQLLRDHLEVYLREEFPLGVSQPSHPPAATALHQLPPPPDGTLPAAHAMEWILVLSGKLEDVDRAQAEVIIEHLRGILADTHLTLKKIESGSVKLIVQGSFSGFETAKRLSELKKLRSIEGLTIESVEREVSAHAALRQLPPPPPDFTGRESELREILSKIEKGTVISGLQGMGGVGKTALALVLAERLTERYPDAQFYLDLKGTSPQPLTPAEAMAHVIRAYNPETKLPEEEAQLSPLYHSVLHGQRAILLMDNARDAAQVTPLLPPAGCLLLVTSRWHFALPGLYAKNLDALPLEDARDLLLAIAPRIDGQAEEIARACGYLPLALRAAASLLATHIDLEPADYARRLADAHQRSELVGVSLGLSYDHLSHELQKRLARLAIFPETFHSAAAAAVWDTEPDIAHEALSTLVKYSLLEYDATKAHYRLHDLVRDFARARLTSVERAKAERRHAAHYVEVAGAADELYLKGGEGVTRGLALFDAEWANIQAGQAWVAAHAPQSDDAARLCSAYPAAGAYCLALRQHPRERIRWLEAAVAAARRLKDRGAEGAHLGNLGLAYADLGEPRRAIEFYEQSLGIDREIGNRRGEGQDLGNLGLAYWALGEPRRAIEFYEKRLAIAREIGDRRGEGNALGNLGLAYWALGEPRRAIEFYEKQLVITREIGDRRGEGNSLGNLGSAYYALGETRRAIEFHQKALEIDREIGDRRGEGQDLGNLGLAYADLGETRRAVEFYEKRLAIAREIGDQRGEGAVLGNLGNAYYLLGETRRAIEFYEQQLIITREIGDRRGEGNALFNMGLALDELGERAQAIAPAEAALKILEEIEDPNADKVRKKLAEWGRV